MSREAQLQKALTKLRGEGREIGPASTYEGETVYPVDGVLFTESKIFEAAEISPVA